MLGRVIIVSGVIFGCGYAMHRYTRRKQWESEEEARRAREQREALEECIKSVWSEPRALIADVEGELAGPAITAARTSAGRQAEVSLTPQAQRNAWSIAKYLASEGKTTNREVAIRTMMQQIVAPNCDWSQGWLPYRDDRRFRDVYEGAGLLLDFAELSGKYGARASTEGRGALVCPGWVHQAPAPTAGVRAGDFVEVMVDEYSDDPEDESRYAEWAWVRITSISPDKDMLAGVITLEAPPGAQSNVIANQERHGFAPGVSLVVSRSCVYRVVQGP